MPYPAKGREPSSPSKKMTLSLIMDKIPSNRPPVLSMGLSSQSPNYLLVILPKVKMLRKTTVIKRKNGKNMGKRNKG